MSEFMPPSRDCKRARSCNKACFNAPAGVSQTRHPEPAGSPLEDGASLRNRVAAVEGRLQKLETEGKIANTIIDADEPSVCLIHVVLKKLDENAT